MKIIWIHLVVFLIVLVYNNCGGNFIPQVISQNESATTSPAETGYEAETSYEIDPIEVPDKQLRASQREATNTALGNMEKGVEATELYRIFNEFALSHYGAYLEPTLKAKFGAKIKVLLEGQWQFVSEKSISIAGSTNLPAKVRVEYGLTEDYGQLTAISERYYYNHLRHISNLEANKTYHYRWVAMDEEGNTIATKDKTFTTADLQNVIYIPGNLAGPPYVLNQSGATYLLTEDLNVSGTALDIRGNDITVDLGGYTITYATAHINSVDSAKLTTAMVGIRARSESSTSNIKIVNGRIKEGNGNNTSADGAGGLNPIYLSDIENVEVAGVSVDYHGAQLFGMYFRHPEENYEIHHNVYLDRGWEITNRHGATGGRSVYFKDTSANGGNPNKYKLYYNLIKRTRQNGFSKAQSIFQNEVYVDSWSTNSFALQPYSHPNISGEYLYGNKVFLTGYHAIGVGWSHYDLQFYDNLIHMEGIGTNFKRWKETFGDQDSLNGLRITNYSPGGQKRDGLNYKNNLIIGRARKGGQMRGTEFYSDATIINVILEDSIIDVQATDDTQRVSAVVTQGTYATRDDHNPHIYRNSTLISNVSNVRFGDDYGKGNNHRFINCIFEKAGDVFNDNYHTFIFDGGFATYDHQIIDPVFKGGARFDDVYWKQAGRNSSYAILWTLTVNGAEASQVEIRNVKGELVFDGLIDATGKLKVPLIQADIRPIGWVPNLTGAGGGIDDKTLKQHQKILHTPHQVKITNSGTKNVTVTMDKAKSI